MAIPEADPTFLAWWNANWAKLSGRSAQTKSVIIWQAARQVGKTQALKDVEAERKRQIEVLGRTHEADDQYQLSELPRSASVYIMPTLTEHWPWDFDSRPKLAKTDVEFRRNLVKAAALLLAEIERLDRSNGTA